MAKRKPFFSEAFLYGFSRAFDISGALKKSVTFTDFGDDAQAWERDYEALKGDWIYVGQDIAKATAKYAETV